MDGEGDRAVEVLGDGGGFDFEAAGGGVDALFDHDFAEVAGSGELNVFGHDVGGFDGAAIPSEQSAADVGDEVFGCTGASGDEHAFFTCGEPTEVEFAGVVEEFGVGADVLGDFSEAHAVAAVAAADHEDHVAAWGELADGVLAVGGGVADVAAGRLFDVGKRLLEGVDDDGGVVGAEGGLREVDEFVCVFDVQMGNVFGRLDDLRRVRGFAAGADDFLVVFVAYEQNLVALAGVADGFGVNFGNERTGGVDGGEFAIGGLLADGGGNAVGAEDDDAAFGDFGEVVNEFDAGVLEATDDVLVVDDFVVAVDGLAWEEVDDLVDDIDGHADACTEAAWVGEDEVHEGEVTE